MHPGTLAISELITRVVKGLPGVKQTGYSGLMLPVCEDAGLAAAAAQVRRPKRSLHVPPTACP